MRRITLALVIVCAFVDGSGTTNAEVEGNVSRPRKALYGEAASQVLNRMGDDSIKVAQIEQVLAQARQAQFGNLASQKVDVVLKFKGSVDIWTEKATFEGEFICRLGGRDRLTLTVSLPSVGRKLRLVDGKWERPDEAARVLGLLQRMDIERVPADIRAALLAALLQTGDEKALWLGEWQFDGRKVTRVGRGVLDRNSLVPPSYIERIYDFDKETGCLLKMAKPLAEEPPAWEVVFSNHTALNTINADMTVLKEVGLGVDADSLAVYLKKGPPKATTKEKLKALIIKLGDDEFEARELATTKVIAAGAAALPLLAEASKSSDLEVARRAKDAIAEIQRRSNPALVSAAVRVLARLKAATATGVLLDYLDGAREDSATEVQAALAALAYRDGKPDPVLEKALTDKDASKRAAAEAALGRDGGAYLRKPVRRLYPDKGRFPTKATILQYKSIKVEIELVDVQLFNRLPDRMFGPPVID